MTDIAEDSSSESVRPTPSHSGSDFPAAFRSEGVSAGTGAGSEGAALAAPSAAHLAGPLELRPVDPGSNGGRKEAAFIDASVADHQILVTGVRPGVAVLLLQNGTSGLAQMAAWAGERSGYDAIHLLSHGTQAQLHLGNDVFTGASLSSPTVQEQLATIGGCLNEDGDLLIYGCEIGKGNDGAGFVTKLAAATGAGVAASSGLTGSSAAGGDWVLETISGGVTTEALSITSYPFTLLPAISSYSGGISATNTYYRPWTPADIAIVKEGGTEAADTVYTGDQITQTSSKLYNYALATFIPTSSGTFTFSVPAADLSGSTTDAGDVFMAVYQSSFDPKDPLKNLLYANDDSASAESDFRSEIADVPLNAFGHYIVVITSFSPSATGSFTIEATGPSLGTWAGPDADAVPIITSGDVVSFLENGTGTVYAATVNTRSADGAVTYTLGGADAALFTLNSTTGVLTFKTAPDFETPADSSGDNIYNVTLSVSDGSGTAVKDIAIAVTDVAESPIPAITSTALTSSAAPILTGTAKPGFTVTVEVAGATYGTVAGLDGRWSLDLGSAVPLTGILALNSNGANSVTASVGETGSTVTVSQTLIIDTTAPVLAITSKPVTSDTTPIITGTAEVGSVVTVRVEDATYSFTATNSTWSLDLESAVPLSGILALNNHGTNSISVTARDPAGNTSSTTQTLLIDTIAPAVAITSAPVTSDTTPIITGTADTDSTVIVTVAGATYSTKASDGVWSVDLGSAKPVAGTLALDASGANTISVTATDPAGNISTVPATATLTINPSVPAVVTTSGVLGGSTYHRPWTPADLALAGGQGADATPTVYRGNQITTTSDLAYSYAATTFTPTKAGSFTFTVSAAEIQNALFGSDVFMAVYKTSFDPEHPLNNLIYANDDTSAQDYRPTIPDVFLEPFTRYIVVVSANDPDVTGTYTIAATGLAGGSWMEADTGGSLVITSDPSAVFAENDTGPVYTAEVSAGENAVAYTLSGVDAGLFILDATTGILTFKSAPDYEKPADSGGDNVYDVTVTATGAGGQDTQDIAITVTNVLEGSAPTITSGELTRDSTPVITGTATAGSVVTIAVAGATYAVTATDGTWSLDLGAAVPRAGTLALDLNGANSVSVSIAGEEAEVVTQQLTIDTTAPSLAITSITLTSDSIPVITGTAETDAIVTITVESATYSLVATDGAWSLDLGAAVPETGTLTLNLGGANKVSATATDAAGNTATADQTLILDGAAATTTLISGQLTGNSYYRPWTPADIAMVLEGGSADTVTVYAGNEISESAPDLYNYATAVFVPILAGSFTFSVSAADIPDASFDFSDVFMAVYEASFDPEDPLNNLIYANDDTSETDFKPTIANIQLQPFTHYIVVLTAYDPVATGTYTIAAKGPAGGAWMGADTGESLVIISDPSAVFAENDTGPVYTAEVSAGENAVAYTLSGVDAGLFILDATTGILTFKSAPDYEKPADSGGDNVYDVTVTATGAGGQDTQDIAITVTNVLEGAAPTITSGELTRDSTPVITGTATAGSVVTIAVAGATYAVTATDGTWSLDLGASTPLAGTLALNPNGANTVSVNAADTGIAPVIRTLTIDTIAPTVAITSGVRTSDSTPVITGIAEAGATVSIAVAGATYSVMPVNGSWSLDLGTATATSGILALNAGGANNVSVSATDAAGNIAITTQTLTIDTLPPPVVTPPVVTPPVVTPPVVTPPVVTPPVVTPPVVTPPPVTTTIDGVQVQTATVRNTDGSVSQSITIPVITAGRQEQAGGNTVADIPLVHSAAGTSLLAAQVPTGLGLQVTGSTMPKAPDASLTDLIREIRAHTEPGSTDQTALTEVGSDFLVSLPANTPVLVQTIVLTAAPGSDTPAQPLVISGAPAAPGNLHTALVVDARALPPGSEIQLQNVDFASIIGAVKVTGGNGSQVAWGDGSSQTIILGADDDVLHGGAGDDIVGSAGGNDRIFGDEGNDTVFGGAGNDFIDGGTGRDTLVLTGAVRGDYTVRIENGRTVFSHRDGGADGTDTVAGVEMIRFSGHDFSSETAVDRLYEALLNRTPDTAGKAHWMEAIGQGMSMRDVASQILESAEATNLHGSLTEGQFTDMLYRTVLHRAGDGSGKTGWEDFLKGGGARTDMVLAFVNSDEKMASEGTLVDFNTSEVATLVRLYGTMLGRLPDEAGINSFISHHEAGLSLADIADVFVGSGEARQLHGDMTDEQYVDMLYREGLGREADEGGRAGWLNGLGSGALDRGDILLSIADSAEMMKLVGVIDTSIAIA